MSQVRDLYGLLLASAFITDSYEYFRNHYAGLLRGGMAVFHLQVLPRPKQQRKKPSVSHHCAHRIFFRYTAQAAVQFRYRHRSVRPQFSDGIH